MFLPVSLWLQVTNWSSNQKASRTLLDAMYTPSTARLEERLLPGIVAQEGQWSYDERRGYAVSESNMNLVRCSVLWDIPFSLLR